MGAAEGLKTCILHTVACNQQVKAHPALLARSAGLAAHDRGASAPGPVCRSETLPGRPAGRRRQRAQTPYLSPHGVQGEIDVGIDAETSEAEAQRALGEIGRASCRERV